MEKQHPVFANDPVYYYSLLNCYVVVQTTDGKEHTGWVHTVDPVSASVILVQFEDSGTGKEVTFVSGHNVSSVKILEKDRPPGIDTTINSLFRKEQVKYSNKELTAKREALCVWLSENRVPYTVKDDLSIEVLQAALIRQPYGAEDVQCMNEVVLDNVMKLVQRMPSLT
ncbi:hypothetical protein Pcinc_024510 [Petrolisthes cinctipes]|uniref:AD domain-containing protein n=1 Tax=Petrolisthes cinctipes TaxID=88211 RepID=A0AAE1KAQ1_PETCI|nr:hypothetical protein Pcinc_024510 [Petrolisthes cinctipes]